LQLFFDFLLLKFRLSCSSDTNQTQQQQHLSKFIKESIIFSGIFAASQLVSHAQSSIKNMIYGLVKGLILINNKSGSFQVPTIRRV
jgi:hypothetical protein